MKQKSLLKKVRGTLLTMTMLYALSLPAQNVYDTYNPSMDSIVNVYQGDTAYIGYTGEYQLYCYFLNAWNIPLSGFSISYKIEPVSFPFTPDCSNGDCGNSGSTTRNLVLIPNYSTADYTYAHPFKNQDSTGSEEIMSEFTTLVSNAFTTTLPPGGERDFVPHTVLQHTYYLHFGNGLEAPIVDSFKFVLDHTRGYMSEYPFRSDNGQSNLSQHDVTVLPWFAYFSNDSFLTIPEQSSNFMGTLDYFPYPDANYFPGPVVTNWAQIPDTAGNDRYSPSPLFTHPSPFSLVAVMLCNAGWVPFAGTDNSHVPRIGVPHTYYIDTSFDLRLINPHERIIYNPSSVYITSSVPIVFPSGYTFMTVNGLYPTRTQVENLDPDTMYANLINVPITGSALNLTDNPNTVPIDSLSYYYVTSGCTLRIESCVTIYDATIVVQAGGRIELDTNQVYGNYIIQIDSGGVLAQQGSSPSVSCPYLCYESSNYNERHVTISTNTTWDTTNIESSFPGTATWAAATNNTAKFVEGITIDSGATLTIGPGVNLLFGPLGKVVVKKGGRLFVNGTVTDSCHFGPACQIEWNGIQVWGDSAISQNNPYGLTPQGYALLNYCVVDHAHNAVTVGQPGTARRNGGEVDAGHCSFLNNVRGIVVQPYRNFALSSPYSTMNNRSSIDNCDFRTTEYFYDPLINADYGLSPLAATAHISLLGVKGVTIVNCIFRTDQPENYKPHLRGTGIYSLDGSFVLYSAHMCTFENLSDAIWLQGTGIAPAAVSINGATFANNIHSIVAEGTQFTSIFKNEIDVPESPEFSGYTTDDLEKGYNKPVGVFMIGSINYRIEENEFNVGDTASQITPVNNCDNCAYDIVVYNTMFVDSNPPVYGDGTIYKNIIHHSTIGVQVQGDNGVGPNSDGLDVKCNEFDELVSYDIILAGRGGTSPVATTLRDQGDCNVLDPELQATNTYLRSCTPMVDETNVKVGINSSGFLYQDQAATFPACTTNLVLASDCGFFFSDTNTCASHLTSRNHLGVIALNYTNATIAHESARYELDSLVDGWKELGSEYWTSPPDFYSIYMPYSPWLSDSTLLSLFDPENRQYISDDQLVEILVANSGLSPEVYETALSADPAIDERYMDDLVAAQTTPSARILKEREWMTWKFQANLAATEITEYALRTDSLTEGISELIAAKEISEMQKLFALQLAARAFEDAAGTLENILTTQDNEESAWTLLAAISLQQAEEGRSWLQATTEEIAVSDSIWNANPEKAIGPRVVTAYHHRLKFAREPFELESGARYGNTSESSTPELTSLAGMNVFPNPAANSATIAIGVVSEGASIQVMNALGQVVETIQVKSGGTVQLDLSQYPSGIAYLRLISNGECVETEKLMIIK